jgi:hypothetical protein
MQPSGQIGEWLQINKMKVNGGDENMPFRNGDEIMPHRSGTLRRFVSVQVTASLSIPAAAFELHE